MGRFWLVIVDIAGPAGRLEALLEEPAEPRFAAIVCHPHPRYGGTMHTHAAYRLARAVRAKGGTALRFNYRGVGRSAGTYSGGAGEAEDTAAVLAWLAARRPDLPRLACGFSFGAWMALLAGSADRGVRGLLLAGVALSSPDLELARDTALLVSYERPLAAVQAAGDEFGPPEAVRALLAQARAPRRLAVVPGATHLFTEALPELQREAEVALDWLLGGGT